MTSPVRIAALLEQVWPRRVLDLKVGDLLVTFVVSTLRYANVRAVDVDELAEKLAVPRACIEMTNVQAGIEFRVDLGDVTPIEVPCGRQKKTPALERGAPSSRTPTGDRVSSVDPSVQTHPQRPKPTGRTETLELCRDVLDHEGERRMCILERGHGGEHECAIGWRWYYVAAPAA